MSERATAALRGLAGAYVQLGRRAEARELLRELEAREAWMPELYAALGQKERAIEQLQRALEERNTFELLYIRCGVLAFDLTGSEALRGDPRFERILREIDFPD